MVNKKRIFLFLLIVVPVSLLLQISFQSTITPLFGERQGFSARKIFTLRDLIRTGTKNCTNRVYVRPPPWSRSLPIIYVITPTYSRLVQKADLTRMSNTLLHVANLHWIVVEDAENKTSLVTNFLNNTGLNYTHLNVHKTERLTSRGSRQRNLALQWLRDRFSVNDSHPGVVYFADDDNSYSLELFDEMRYTKKVSVWPVGFTGAMRYQSIKVNAMGKVYGWETRYAPTRRFAIDMAGFAVSLKLILSKPKANFRLYNIVSGQQETRFLEGLVTMDDLEPKAANCTKVLVWHTRTSKPSHFIADGDPNIET